MKNEKTYEEKIADIKRYLKEKEEEVRKNRVTEVRRNPVIENNDIPNIDKTLEFRKENFINSQSEEINDVNDIPKVDRVDNYYNEVKLEPIENDISSKEDNKADIDDKPKKSKLDIILIILLLLEPLFITLSVISLHSTYLVSEPINYLIFGLSGISGIGILCISLLKLVNKKGKNLKYLITVLIITILDILLLTLFINGKMWKKLDPIIEHKKLFLIIFFLIILVIITILIIRKVKHKKLKDNVRKIVLTIFMTLYILSYFDLLVVLYGPVKEFKNWLITTAMQTMNHQYFCKWFYNGDDIEYVLSQNYVLESGESTNPDLIDLNKEKVVYENEYEEAVLKKDNPDDTYKIIELDVNGCKGYLAVIYDPTTVHVAVTQHVGSYGQYVTTMAKNENAVLAINGGGFYDPGNSSAGGTPTGITIVDGKIVTNGEYGTNVQSGGIIGFDDKGVLYLLKNTTAQQAIDMGIIDAVSWGPFLIVNGEASFIKGNGGWGYAARTAIGQREDGIVLFLVVDSNASRTNGADMVDLTEIMQNYGAVNAANLDGGTSSVMVLPKKQALKYNSNCSDDYCTINDPIDGALRHQTRAISDAFVVVEK